MLQMNVLNDLGCICWCLAEQLQADVIFSYLRDLVLRQPWHASCRSRPTIVVCKRAVAAQAVRWNSEGEKRETESEARM
jgi:hypothetical protein